MSQLATNRRASLHDYLALASEDVVDCETPEMPRWSVILEAREAIALGVYDNEEVVNARLDACMDSILDDLAVAG